MKRCALIIADDHQFREWIGCHVTTRWPKMLLEYSGVTNAPMYLDRAQLDRYQIIVVRLGFKSFAEMQTCIFLMRILDLASRPEVVLISETADELKSARSTKLSAAYCVPSDQLTSATMQAVLEDVDQKQRWRGEELVAGAPSIPGYVIKSPIAGTYTATVYRAFSKQLRKDVALKICDVSPVDDGAYHQLTLRQEYEILRKLGGEYVAHAYEYGETGGLGFLALEYFQRGSIDRLFAKSGRNVSRTDYLLRVAQALREIHNAGFLHLDLKPNNVLIRDDGSPALIDFGISKRIVAARYQDNPSYSMGSPYFMSPEQARGDRLDVRSDLYSFGALWYRIFTGRIPFPGRSIEEICLAREQLDAPSMGSVLRHYQPVVDQTLVGDREKRFSTAQELIDNIRHCASSATGHHRRFKSSAASPLGRITAATPITAADAPQ